MRLCVTRLLPFVHILLYITLALWEDVLSLRSKRENSQPHMEIICVPDAAFLHNALVLT